MSTRLTLVERLQKLVSSLLLSGSDGAAKKHLQQMSAAENEPAGDPIADVEWPAIAYINRPKRIKPRVSADGEKDNFLRGDLIPEQRRRRTTDTDRVAISYWRHGIGSSCCKESHRSEDFHEIAPTSSLYSKKLGTDLRRSGYIDLNSPGMGMELSNLSSFISESGKHSVYTPPEPVEPPRENPNPGTAGTGAHSRPTSATLTKMASQIKMIESTLSELARDPDPVVRAMAAVNPRTPISDLEELINDESQDVRDKARQNVTNMGLNIAA